MTNETRLQSVSRRKLLQAGALLPLSGAMAWAQAQESDALTRIRKRGSLIVAVYNAMPPFNVDGSGIDVKIAAQLALTLGVKLSLLPFNAGENMEDDLRNMVWKGHYLGFGPADVLLHVPVDKPLMDSQSQALIFAPYYREVVSVAYRVDRVPKLESLADLKDNKVAVAGQTLAGWLLIGADGGAYREQLMTRMDDGAAAARLLLSGEVSVAAGNASELHSVLKGDKQYRVIPMPIPRAPRSGWAVGMAVKKNSTELARVLQSAVNDMSKDERMTQIFAEQGVPWGAA
ncbi:substrate-binding periplasmic protein [Rhodoferax ferrireducens]|uniref:substrate-binding periplasmic protein n=1 Tax=Rhodoferax ferrireducens TaxID=192843 RepID=UPI0018E55B3F|nr:transporter substrate-binding domain-containing protein [Rhodoferax ferrireducens]